MIKTRTRMLGDLSGDLARFEQAVQEKVTIAGAAAMAKVIYDEAKGNAPTSDKEHYFHGSQFRKTGKKYLFQPGTLRDAIYRVYSPERSDGAKKLYRVTWNHRKAPYGFMVEFGTSRAPASPFMAPAFDRIQDAIAAGKGRMAQVLLTLDSK